MKANISKAHTKLGAAPILNDRREALFPLSFGTHPFLLAERSHYLTDVPNSIYRNVILSVRHLRKAGIDAELEVGQQHGWGGKSTICRGGGIRGWIEVPCLRGTRRRRAHGGKRIRLF